MLKFQIIFLSGVFLLTGCPFGKKASQTGEKDNPKGTQTESHLTEPNANPLNTEETMDSDTPADNGGPIPGAYTEDSDTPANNGEPIPGAHTKETVNFDTPTDSGGPIPGADPEEIVDSDASTSTTSNAIGFTRKKVPAATTTPEKTKLQTASPAAASPPSKDTTSKREDDDLTLLIKKAYEGDVVAVRQWLKKPKVRENINTKNRRQRTVFSQIAGYGYRPNNLEILVLLVEHGADPLFEVATGRFVGDLTLSRFDLVRDNTYQKTIPSGYGDTLLIRAVRKGNVDLVRRLLRIPKIKRTVNVPNRKAGESAFFIAVRNLPELNYESLLNLLLNSGADPNLPTYGGVTPLIQAARDANKKAVERLLKIPTVKENINTEVKHSYGTETAISAALGSSILRIFNTPREEIVLLLLENGAKGDVRLLEGAVKAGAVESVKRFLKAGAPLFDYRGDIPALQPASRNGHAEITALLLAVPAVAKKIKETDFLSLWNNYFIFNEGVMPDRQQAIKDLFKKAGAPGPESKDRQGNTVLMKAVSRSGIIVSLFSDQETIERIKRLLEIPEVKQSINEKNKRGETAFSQAVFASQFHPLLLAAGADPVLFDSRGGTLLIRFIEKSIAGGHVTERDIKTVKNLVQIPAIKENINARLTSSPYKGQTALSLAISKTSGANEPVGWHFVDILLEAGADPNLPDENGNTLLMKFVHLSDEAVERFLKIPAVKENINARNSEGDTAFAKFVRFYAQNLREIETPRQRRLAIKLWHIINKFLEAGANTTDTNFNLRNDQKLPFLLTCTDLLIGYPLHWSSENTSEDRLAEYTDFAINVVKDLLKHTSVKNNINVRSEGRWKGTTAFSSAIRYRGEPAAKIADLLLEAGADPNLPDENGDTFLMKSIKDIGDYLSHSANLSVRRLLEIPAVRETVKRQNHAGETALSLAKSAQAKLNSYESGEVAQTHTPEEIKNAKNQISEIINNLTKAESFGDEIRQQGKADNKQNRLKKQKKQADLKNPEIKKQHKKEKHRGTAQFNKGIPLNEGFWDKFFSGLKSLIP